MKQFIKVTYSNGSRRLGSYFVNVKEIKSFEAYYSKTFKKMIYYVKIYGNDEKVVYHISKETYELLKNEVI